MDQPTLEQGWLAHACSQGLLDLYGSVDGSLVLVDILSVYPERRLAVIKTWSRWVGAPAALPRYLRASTARHLYVHSTCLPRPTTHSTR